MPTQSVSVKEDTSQYPLYPFLWRSLYEYPPEYREIRATAPISRVRLPNDALAWLVTRYEDVRAVLSDARFSRDAVKNSPVAALAPNDIFNHSLIGTDPPDHTRLRRLVTRAFTPRRMEALRPHTFEVIDELLDQAEQLPRPVDFQSHVCYLLPILVIAEMLGLPYDEREQFVAWVRESTAGTEYRERMSAGYQKLIDYLDSLIQRKRRTPGDDLLSALIAVRDENDDRLSHEELLALSALLLAAGHETTATLFGNSIVTLLRDRTRWDTLRNDVSLIPVAVDELFRMVPTTDIGGVFPRVALEDVTLNGVRIHAGDAVMAVGDAANRDPEVFDDPERLDLTRQHNPHMSLGAGIHRCLGATLTRMELQVALQRVMERFPTLRLAVPESELRIRPMAAMRTLDALPVTW
ncbi:cytochrome P450 [Wenjunlia vitaminophila]|nr:cytochrome P450 [Wenjunlia vitaminophila]